MGKKGTKGRVIVSFDKESRKNYLVGMKNRRKREREKCFKGLKNKINKTKVRISTEQIKPTVINEQQKVEVKEDKFSAEMFGSAKVTITTTTFDGDDVSAESTHPNDIGIDPPVKDIERSKKILTQMKARIDREKARKLRSKNRKAKPKGKRRKR